MAKNRETLVEEAEELGINPEDFESNAELQAEIGRVNSENTDGKDGESKPSAGDPSTGAAPDEPAKPVKENIKIQRVESKAVIEVAARHQSIGGHAPDITPVSERQDTGEDPKPREDKSKHANPVLKVVNGFPVYRPGQHPKERQIRDRAGVEEAVAQSQRIEVVDTKSK